MSKGKSWLVILGALVVGVLAGNLFVRSTGTALPLSMSCLYLASAEQAGYLDKAKRTDLVGRVAKSTVLDAKERELAAQLQTSCPRF
jgi:uncharacterized membrane-anchored protein YhcB (DUF1043 family)